MRLSGKVAIITGAGSGIGRSAAQLFAREGASVVVADLDYKAGKETEEMICQVGGKSMFVETDVSVSSSVENLIKQTITHFGRLDIMFNNAGIDLAYALTETTEETWDKIISINLKGVFLGCKYSILAMQQNGGGVIINTASILAEVVSPNQAAYCASKGGVVSLTRQIAIDYAASNIRVNCICPGDVMTPMQESVIRKSENPEETLKYFAGRYPMKRFAQPEEIAEVAVFLASDSSSFITGQMIVADGGLSIW